MEQLAFNLFDRRLQGKHNTANKEQHHEGPHAWPGFFLGSISRSNHFGSSHRVMFSHPLLLGGKVGEIVCDIPT